MAGHVVPHMETSTSPSAFIDSTTVDGEIDGSIYGTIYPTIYGSKNGAGNNNPSGRIINSSGSIIEGP